MLTVLQLPGIPAGPEVFVVLVLVVVVGILVGGWVYRDAKSRGSSWAWQWGVGIAVLFVTVGPGLLVLLVYLLVRGDKTPETRQAN